MNGQTRTQTYPGLFQSQAEDAFRRDAAEAAQHGWFPTSQHWNGQALVVTYAYGPQPANRWGAPVGVPAPQAAPAQTPVVPAAAVVIGSAVAIAMGSFLPWGSVNAGLVRVEQSGMQGGDGWLFLILAGVLALGGWATLRGSTGRTWVTILVASVIVVGAALYEALHIATASILNEGQYGVSIQTGVGILLILAAGIVASLASFGVRKRRAVPLSAAAAAPAAAAPVVAGLQAPVPQAVAPEPAQSRSEGMSPVLVAGAAIVAIAIGGIAGMAMLGMGPFAGPRTVPIERIRPYVPDPTDAGPLLPTARPPAQAAGSQHEKLGDRAWAQVVKDPDAHVGERLQAWACITQFDAATGSDSFRGDASNKKLGEYEWFGADNALFSGTEAQVRRFVEDDVVAMDVTVLGSLTYDTQIGGSMTAPVFQVDAIKRAGSC